MTQQEFEEKFKTSSLGETWAFVENFIAGAISAATAAPEAAKALAEQQLADRLVAVQKAEDAIKSGDAQAAIEALAAITVTKQTDKERELALLNKQIAELEAKKLELSKA